MLNPSYSVLPQVDSKLLTRRKVSDLHVKNRMHPDFYGPSIHDPCAFKFFSLNIFIPKRLAKPLHLGAPATTFGPPSVNESSRHEPYNIGVSAHTALQMEAQG